MVCAIFRSYWADRSAYEVVDIQGDAPNQHFKVECTVEGLPVKYGEGSSRRFAEQAVAAEILEILEKKS